MKEITIRKIMGQFILRPGALLTAAMLMALAPAGQAQVTATVSGTVTDPTGALVQGASISVINDATHETRSTVTGKSGTFTMPNLNPNTYLIKVTAQGFKPSELTGIEVHVGEVVRLPTFVLAIGTTTDTVTVSSVSGQILSLENGQRSTTLTYTDIQDLALTGRDTSELLKVLPGVVQVGQTGYNSLSVTTGTSAIGNGMGINGAPYKGGTALNMDGASIIDVGDQFASLATINPEMTQEVQVLTSAFGADTANGPNVINATGRSGGEHYHGEGYFNVRNDVMNANDWVDNHVGNPKAGASYYYPGGGIGGPVPGTHKKVFFYGAFEIPFQNQGNANILKGYIPSPEMLAGNFSTDNANNRLLCPGGFYNSGGNGSLQPAWCNNIAPSAGNTNATILPDGSSPRIATSAVPTVPAGALQQQGTAAGGYIPSKFIDPNMLAFAKVWPAWTSPYIATTQDQIVKQGGFNYYQPIVNHDNGWVAHGRIDYNWNPSNSFYISYQQSYDSQLSGGAGTNFYNVATLQYPGGGIIKKTYSKVLNGHYVHIFSPTMTNEALASWVWGNIPIVPADPTANLRSTLGFNAGCVYCTNPRYMPTFTGGNGFQNFAYPAITQADSWGTANYYIVQKAIPTFADNLTKVWGRHTTKFGGMTSNTDNYQGNQSTNLQGQLTIGGTPANQFNYFASQGTCSVCGSYTGKMGSYNPTANLVMGNLSNYAESNSAPLSDVAYQTVAFYANDQIKVNRKLSVEAGLRFEHIGWWYDRNGIGLAVFYPQRVLPDFYAGKYAPGFYWHAIDSGVPLSGRPDRFVNVSPRFGISYDVFGTGRTLVRGGWGAYRYQEAANAPQAALNTAQGVKNYSASSVLPANSTFLLSQIGQLAGTASNCQVQCSQAGQTGYSPSNYGVPLTYNYNFTIDQRIPWGMTLDVAYVGNSSKHMSDNGMDGTSPGGYDNQNKTPMYAYGQLNNGAWVGKVDPFTQKTICNPENLNAPCSTGSAAYDFQPYGRATGCTSVSTSSNPNCLIYGTNGVTMIQNLAYQNYNALQASIVKRSGPVTLNANFTWSKSLGTVGTRDPFVMSNNNQYTNLNRPFIFNASYVYRQPNFYHGNRFIAGAVNGWALSGVTLWQKGTNTLPNISIQYDPATLPAPGNPQGLTSNTLGVGQATFFGTNAGITTGRPVLTCDPKSGLQYHQLYRPCFSAAPFGSTGGLHGFVAGQAFMENDLALFKTFNVHEHNQIEFRISAFNWLNHPLPNFAPNNESNTQYYYYNYQTHAVTPNDSTNHGGSGNPGSSILATTSYSNANTNPSDLFGTMHYKQGYGGNSQRILELDLKYSF